ncbi:MAG: ABC transporter permease [Anaerolineae bacterium]|jgi:peptide/nickel transport system permease protein
MTRYLIRQGLLSLVKLFVFVTIMFFFIQIMMPGDFVDQFSISCDKECRDGLRAQLGLDLPIGKRYLNWLRQVATWDLGRSFSGQPIMDTFKEVVPATLSVFVTGTILAFVIGLSLGKFTAWRGTGFVSRVTTLAGITLFTSFPPWLAWLVSHFFTQGRSFAVMGEVGGLRRVSLERVISRDLWIDVEISPSTILFRMILTMAVSALIVWIMSILLRRLTRRRIPGILILLLIAASTVGSWYALQMETLAIDIVRVSWIAIVTYTLLSFGETMIIMQSSMTEVLKEEYINTAHAKGVPASVVREKHAARNALLPVLSRLVISLPYLITGVVIVESSVGWPGMGSSMWNALYWQNMPLVMNTLLIVGILSLAARLFLDVLIAYLDPRIRYDKQRPTVA